MDEVAEYNRKRWKSLAEANALFTRPHLDLTPETARERVDPQGLLGDVHGKMVLCLASGGGQQSAAFALLGARVWVVDLSIEQLQRDKEAAAHYGVEINTLPADMRNLSPLPREMFDIVYQPYSLNFIPDASVVFRQVRRILKPGGLYQFALANPFTQGINESAWNGQGYELRMPYVDGAMIEYPDSDWVYEREQTPEPIAPPREYRHTLSNVLNSLINAGFQFVHFEDGRDMHPDPNAEPGSWDHCAAFAPPWFTLILRYAPDTSKRA